VLADPVASRFLAAYGANVLRIDPPGWEEPGVVPEVTLGKRCARLDLRRAEDRATFEALLSEADILLHGYRPSALDRLGFDSGTRCGLSPGLIAVCLCAYGWSGPWAARRGFDSLVQMSTGIADAGMRWRNADKPFEARCIAARVVSPLRKGESVKVLRMASEEACSTDMRVLIRWQGRTMAVPLSQLAGVNVDPSTAEAIADWHYWVAQRYSF
jgi:hypothetical protein